LEWSEALARATAAPCASLEATDPLYILYTSGTTGKPKGVVRDHGGHAVALAWSMEAIYGMRPGDVFWAASDVGWVVGHSYIVYAPLLAGCTSILYEGQPVGTPETGWPIVANCRGLTPLPVKPGSASVPVPGYDVRVLDATGAAVPAGQIGNIVIRLPLPPGTLPTLWRNDEGYRESYLSRYPGYYLTGDAGFIDGDGYVWVMSRIDDVINVAGHRLSTGAMEEVLAAHPDVAE